MMDLSDLFADEDYRFHMALQRGSPAEFFRPTANYSALIAERKQWLGNEPHFYSAFLPSCEPLLAECIALARDWETFTPEEDEKIGALSGLRERGLGLGAVWEPDFILLKPDAGAGLQLAGGCVCFPSSWNLADKIGRPLEFIHGPVPGLNAQLGRSINSFTARLAPGTAWLRHNWGLSRSPDLNQHPSRTLPRLDETVTLQDVWLRVEHQALVALPRSGGVLFGIRVAMHPLAGLQQDPMAAKRLARALLTMPEEVAAYKGLATARARIVALLETPLTI